MTFSELRDAINEMPPELLDCEVHGLAYTNKDHWAISTKVTAQELVLGRMEQKKFYQRYPYLVLKSASDQDENTDSFILYDTATKEEIAETLNTWLNYTIDEDTCDGWKRLYNRIFSDGVSEKIWTRFPDFHYPDPDTSYEEDAKAFISGFDDYVRGL